MSQQSSTAADAVNPRRFRVALSYVGEKRAYVSRVAAKLAERWGKDAVLYDKYHRAEFARSDLGLYLPDLYHDESDLVVVVLTPQYERKEWTGLEWRAIFDLIKKREDGAVMLCRFEQASVRGLYSTAGFVDLDGMSTQALADLVFQRHAQNEARQGRPASPALPTPPRPAASQSSRPSRLTVPFELPLAAEAFFGRAEQKAQLEQRLRDRRPVTAVVGAAGMGKSALAAEVLAALFGHSGERLASSPFPDGVIFLNLYNLKGRIEDAWRKLADAVAGDGFMQQRPQRDRAAAACAGRRLLVTVEGAEEVDGSPERGSTSDLLAVLKPPSSWLILTRQSSQATAQQSVFLNDTLGDKDAAALLDELTRTRPLDARYRIAVMQRLAGHPLALTWAGHLLARDEEDPQALVDQWQRDRLPTLTDPNDARRGLEWLFQRSEQRLGVDARRALAAAGALGPAAFPSAAVAAVLDGGESIARAAAAEQALKQLAQHGLLRRMPASTDWQFTHALGYQFARSSVTIEATAMRALAAWLYDTISTARGVDASAIDPMPTVEALVRHVLAMLAADSRRIVFDPLGETLLYGLTGWLSERGRTDLVAASLDAVDQWLKSAASDNEHAHHAAASMVWRGDMLSAQGNLDGALDAFRASFDIGQRLAKADPGKAQWQRDLSVSHEKIGNVLSAQSNLDGALDAFRASFNISQRLAQVDPGNAQLQRDLSVSHNKIGCVLNAQGDLDGALDEFRASFDIDQRLATADPGNTESQRDLSISHNKIGDMLSVQGKLDGALDAFRASFDIRQRLAKADPGNAQWQRDLSVSHEKIGNVLSAQSNLDGALDAFRASFDIYQRLAKTDPGNAQWQRDLSVGHNKIGDVLSAQGNLDGALDAFCASFDIRQRLAKADPGNAQWQRDLSVSHEKIGNVLSVQGNLDGALDAFRASFDIRQRLAKADPGNAQWQRDLSVGHNKIGDVLSAQGNRDGALDAFRASFDIRLRLAKADRGNAEWQRDVAVSLMKMTGTAADVDAALRYAKDGRAIFEGLCRVAPGHAGWRHDLERANALIAALEGSA